MYGERLVGCGTRAGEERKDSGGGRGAAACAAGPPQGGLDHATGAGGEENGPDRGGVGEGRDLAGRLGGLGGAATLVMRARQCLSLFLLYLASQATGFRLRCSFFL